MEQKNAWDKLKDRFSFSRDPTPNRKIQLIIVLVVAGMLLLILQNNQVEKPLLPSSPEASAVDEQTSADKSFRQMEKEIEHQLVDMLQVALGTKNVQVMVNVASSERKVYEKDQTLQHDQTSENNGEEHSTTDRQSSSSQLVTGNQSQSGPFISHIEKPTVLGVMIVAEGADQIKVKKWITEAVARVLDISTHRVAVIPVKQEES
ncbi:hypothetical protein [Jeotgalibacillus soli]|uniref:Stage III sporulation protein AG n=1 Tax=Jeotgalibacillus soli TaxID=889306 RepID=A0A0C2VIN9_9BACL|nr:hypothetical protein [Jeotgalibacillus soli]KIL44361.1 hypothetical protein KP78_33250 [Jeotgalibacillus soli]